MDRLLRAAGRCALAFLLVLGIVAVLPRSVRDSVPDAVIGGAVILLVAVLSGRRLAGRSR
ncbi:hypothetical protein OG444_15060 [Streptomyces sp. NBC_01232]|uniref:hypothetical protein n=1 Tax=Streptomyces sp. NBC_01232 TaxID=2903786 RepID=UPI002E1516BD|nr:hypothetical protein OG444_15060 [Streptomyces sp. NBC_01232]